MISTFAKTLAVLYALLAIGVIATAAYVWHIRCEGFGCTGLGIAWFAWVLFYLATWIPGFLARRLLQHCPQVRRIIGWIMAIQLAVGVFLGASWVAYNLV